MGDGQIDFDKIRVSLRTWAALGTLGVSDWGGVASRNPVEFLRLFGCGATTVKELRRGLEARFGPALGREWRSIPCR